MGRAWGGYEDGGAESRFGGRIFDVRTRCPDGGPGEHAATGLQKRASMTWTAMLLGEQIGRDLALSGRAP